MFAGAQQPLPGKGAGSQPTTTPAPVPNDVPLPPGDTSPGAIPEQIAPPANTAGPAGSTPFSGAPSSGVPNGRTDGGTVPNLSK